MLKRIVSRIMLTLLLIGMLTSAFNLRTVGVDGVASTYSSSASSEQPSTEWNMTYGGASVDMAWSVEQTVDGGYIVAGYTESFGSGSRDFWLIKTDSSGNVQWNQTYGGVDKDEAFSVQQTTDGGYIVAGRTLSFGAGQWDVWLVKTDATGAMMWNQTYGGADGDAAFSVVQTSDGGYIIAGYTFSFGVSPDFWLVKTDSSGNVQWSQTYGGKAGYDFARSVQQTSDGGYIVAGSTNSFGAGGTDFWLVKTDATGAMMWNQTYGGADGDVAYSVVQTSDGGYIIAGTTLSFGAGYADFWLVKTDSSGNVQWSQTYGGTRNDDPFSVVQTTDGGYIVAGRTLSFGAGQWDVWLVKTDATGAMIWNQTYGGVPMDEARSVVQTTDGGYIVAGSTESFGAGSIDFWLVKVVGPPRVYVDPKDNIFYTFTTPLYSRFNVTVWVEAVSDLMSYQVYLTANDTLLNITRAWAPTWDAQWVFSGRGTFEPPPVFFDQDSDGYSEAVLVGSVILAGSTFTGVGKLAIIEFEIIYAPAQGNVSSTLDIDNVDTLLFDSNVDKIQASKTNGYYEYNLGARATLTVIGPWSGTEMDKFLRVLEAFENQTSINVEYNQTYPGDLVNLLPEEFEAGRTPGDIIFVWSWFVREMGVEDHVFDVTNLINESDFMLGALDPVKVGDTLYGGAYTGKVKPGFWYRKSFFAANNLTVPTTWFEFTTLLDDIAAIPSIVNPILSGDGVGWPLSDVTEHFLITFGGPQLQRDLITGTVEWNSTQVRTIFTDRLVPLLAGNFSDPKTWNTYITNWWNGEYGLYFMGSWITDMVDNATDLGVFSLPGAEGLVFAADYFFIPAYTQYPEEAKELLKFLASEEAQELQVAKGGHIATNIHVPLDAYPEVDRIVAEILAGKELLLDLDDTVGGEFQTTFWNQLKLLWVNPAQLDYVLDALQAVAPRTPLVYVDPESIIGLTSDEFTVNVKIFNVTNLWGIDIRFSWNSTILEYVNHTVHIPVENYTDGVLHAPVYQIKDEVNATAGTYRIAYVSIAPALPFNGSGTVFNMAFKMKQIGGSPLQFTSTQLVDSNALPIPHRTARAWAMVGVSTPTGTNVTVAPAENVNVTFAETTAEGITTLNITQQPSTEFVSVLVHDIETTANYTGNITIQFAYDPTGLSLEDEESMKIWQWNESSRSWVDITTFVDTNNNIVYGVTSHLSIFGITSNLNIIFEETTVEGETTVRLTETAPNPPTGLVALSYYVIETTTVYTGPITIRLAYDGNAVTPEEEIFIQIWQWNESSRSWVDITTFVDTNNNIVYAQTNSLSIFGITRHIPLPMGITLVDATVSKTIVGQGYNVAINFTIENQDEFTQTLDVVVYANSTVLATYPITLSPTAQIALSFTWDTTGWAKDNYSISINDHLISWVIVAMVGDVSGPDGWPDGKVNIMDLTGIAKIYGVNYPDPKYNVNYDLNDDGKINIADLTKAAIHFGETDP